MDLSQAGDAVREGGAVGLPTLLHGCGASWHGVRLTRAIQPTRSDRISDAENRGGQVEGLGRESVTLGS